MGCCRSSSAEGGILYAFTPIVTMVFASLFLKETTNVMQKISIFLSVFGVLFIFIMKGNTLDWSNMTGIILLVLTCVAFALVTALTGNYVLSKIEVSKMSVFTNL